MPSPETADPVGDGEYVVDQGECLSSIAYENGFLMETLWNHPANAKLKAARNDPNVLLPGDRVHIPDKRIREESCAADGQYQFVLKGVSDVLRIVLLDADGKPRKSLPYTLRIKGSAAKSGKTDPNGLIEASILPNARNGELIVHGETADEHYELSIGTIDPPSTVSGIQARLNHLGFSCGKVDGKLGPLTSHAINSFQKSQNLPLTGKMDDKTREALVSAHGF